MLRAPTSLIRQRGQAIVLSLAVMLMGVGTLVLLYNTGQTASEKMRVVNAADAAAYSGAVWTARNLNFMAYTNRAMIANHVAVGHFTSFMSWVRYLEGTTALIATVTALIPKVGQVTKAVDEYATYLRTGVEVFGGVYVPVVDALNKGLHASQLNARVNLNPLTLYNVMNKTADQYGNIRVNDVRDLDELDLLRGVLTAGRIGIELTQIQLFAKSYNVMRDSGRMEKMVNDSLGPSRKWIENRGWKFCSAGSCSPRILGNFKLEKKGNTSQIYNSRTTTNTRGDPLLGDNCSGLSNSGRNDGLNWYAEDKLTLRGAAFFGWIRVPPLSPLPDLCGDASATEAVSGYSGYQGVSDYNALSDDRGADHRLYLTAFSTTPMGEARLAALGGSLKPIGEPPVDKLTAAARAEIYYKRPDPPFFSAGPGNGDYANLFNPFWQVRLTGLL